VGSFPPAGAPLRNKDPIAQYASCILNEMRAANIAFRLGAVLLAVISVCLTSTVNSTRAEHSPAKRIVSLLEAKYRSARTMQATFLERYAENNRTVRVEAGTAYFRRPGKMRWEYESPEKNLFLVDGKTAWFYVAGDHTVTRVPAKESGDWRTPLSLLAGEAKLSRICQQIQLSTTVVAENPEDAVLYCAPRGEEPQHGNPHQLEPNSSGRGEGEAIFLEVAEDSGELVRTLVQARGGVGVEFRFTHWKMDPPVPDSMFRFEPPSGVAIVNGELAGPDHATKP
jgi:outer membrane lipoprotein carrier protein